MDEDEVIDMDVLDDLCTRYDIRRNQRISTLMDAIDETVYEDDDDDSDDEDED